MLREIRLIFQRKNPPEGAKPKIESLQSKQKFNNSERSELKK